MRRLLVRGVLCIGVAMLARGPAAVAATRGRRTGSIRRTDGRTAIVRIQV